jgi:hypothetical protein
MPGFAAHHSSSSLHYNPSVARPILPRSPVASRRRSHSGDHRIHSPGTPGRPSRASRKVISDATEALAKAQSRSARKLNDSLVYLDGPQIYTCAQCRTHLTSHDEIISKSFHGRHGKSIYCWPLAHLHATNYHLSCLHLFALQVGRTFLITVSTLALDQLKIGVSSLAFTVFVIYSVSDAKLWLVGPTRGPMNAAKNTKKGSSLSKRSIYI